jgi:hypothetical protein
MLEQRRESNRIERIEKPLDFESKINRIKEI